MSTEERPSDEGGGEPSSARGSAPSDTWPTLLSWLITLCKTVDDQLPAARRPRVRTGDVIFCLVVKVMLRQSYSLLSSLFHELNSEGYVERLPTRSTLANYLNDARLTPIFEELIGRSSTPLRGTETHFAVDSTPFRLHQFCITTEKNTGKMVERRTWIRLHIICSVTTGIITAARATSRFVAEQKVFEPLLRDTVALGFNVRGVSGDKNYLSRRHVQLVRDIGAIPYLTFKKNSRKREGDSEAWVESFDRFKSESAADLEFFRRRNMVEATFSAIKRRTGWYVESKNEVAQYNEALCKVLSRNLIVLSQHMYMINSHKRFTFDT